MNNKNTKAQDLKNVRGWSIALGILLIILGILAIVTLPSILAILAIASPSIALRSMTVVLSWTFLIAGILRINLAIETQRARGFWLKLVLSILHLAVSVLLLNDIIGSVFPLTLALGMAIFIEGVFEVFLAFQLRPKSSWNCLILKGIATIIVGISIGSEKPFSVFGILVLLPGIILITTGIWTIVFSKAICADARNVATADARRLANASLSLTQQRFAIALHPDTPSQPLVKQNKVFVTQNLHKSC